MTEVQNFVGGRWKPAFGCAGQRCLANSLAISVGEARGPFTEVIAEAAASRRVGYGLNDEVEMGAVIRPESRTRIERFIGEAEREGARVRVDGRCRSIEGFGSFQPCSTSCRRSARPLRP